MILISGSNGLLGNGLKNYFKLNNIKFKTIGRQNCDFNGDIKDNAFIEDKIKNIAPNIFINLAGLTNVDECEKNLSLTYKLNVEFPEVILKALKKNQKNYYFIQFSTDMVYSNEGPHTEENACPINEYSKSKVEIEKKIINYNAISLRTNFFGKSRNINKLSFSDKIYLACSRKKNIELFKDVFFSPVSFNTVYSIISILIKKNILGIYNMGSNKGMTKEQFGIAFCNELKLEKKYIKSNSLKEINLYAKRPQDMRLDNTKLEKKLNLRFDDLIDEIKNTKKDYLL